MKSIECLTRKNEIRRTALRLTEQIKIASWLGKRALNRGGRRSAYTIKAEKLSNGLLHFNGFFKVKSYEQHEKLGILVVVKLADKSLVHIPLKHLTKEVQASINFANIVIKETLMQKKYLTMSLGI